MVFGPGIGALEAHLGRTCGAKISERRVSFFKVGPFTYPGSIFGCHLGSRAAKKVAGRRSWGSWAAKTLAGRRYLEPKKGAC